MLTKTAMQPVVTGSLGHVTTRNEARRDLVARWQGRGDAGGRQGGPRGAEGDDRHKSDALSGCRKAGGAVGGRVNDSMLGGEAMLRSLGIVPYEELVRRNRNASVLLESPSFAGERGGGCDDGATGAAGGAAPSVLRLKELLERHYHMTADVQEKHAQKSAL